MAHHNDQVGMLGRFYCEFNMRSNLPFKVKSTAAWVGIQAAFLFYIAEIKKGKEISSRQRAIPLYFHNRNKTA